MKSTLMWMACVVVLFETLGAQAEEPLHGKKYALLVGVHQYSEAKELRPLPFAENDVNELAEALRVIGFRQQNIVIMTQKRGADELRFLPLRTRILKELRLLLKNRDKEDTVLIALAGHGVHFKGDKESYFCPADADLSDRKTLIPLGELYAELKEEKCKAGIKLLLVDACRNDPLVDATRSRPEVDLASVTRPNLPDPPGGVMAFFSCSEREKAYEDDVSKHGVFFHFLIEGLRGEAADENGEITLGGLIKHVPRNVDDFVRLRHADNQQPELFGKIHGSVPLGRLPEDLLLVHEGRTALKRKRYDRAVEKFTKALEGNNRLAAAYSGRAEARFGKGILTGQLKESSDQILVDCDQAIRLDPRLAQAYVLRARGYHAKSDNDKAIEDCTQALRLDPSNVKAMLTRSLAYLDQKKTDEARDDLTRAARLAPKDAELHWRFGDVYRSERNYDRAFAEYEEALKLDNGFTCVRVSWGIAYEGKGEYDRAIKQFAKVIESGAKARCGTCLLNAHKGRARGYFAKKDYDRGIADCNEAIRLDAKATDAFVNRAIAYYNKNDVEKAIADSSEAIRLDPKLAQAYHIRAYAYHEAGKEVEAQADLETYKRLTNDK